MNSTSTRTTPQHHLLGLNPASASPFNPSTFQVPSTPSMECPSAQGSPSQILNANSFHSSVGHFPCVGHHLHLFHPQPLQSFNFILFLYKQTMFTAWDPLGRTSPTTLNPAWEELGWTLGLTLVLAASFNKKTDPSAKEDSSWRRTYKHGSRDGPSFSSLSSCPDSRPMQWEQRTGEVPLCTGPHAACSGRSLCGNVF